MADIEKLIELIAPVLRCLPWGQVSSHTAGDIADRLIANGVTIQTEGEWVGEADGYADGELVYDVWYCSECNYCIDDGTDDPDLLPNYCQNCGARMKPPKGE